MPIKVYGEEPIAIGCLSRYMEGGAYGHGFPIKVYGGVMEPLKGCTSSLGRGAYGPLAISLRKGAYGPLAIGCLSRSMEG